MESYLGTIQLFAFDYKDQNWMLCDGSLLNRAQNQALFSLIGTKYGGDGMNNFALPDLRNAAPNPNSLYYIAVAGIYPQMN